MGLDLCVEARAIPGHETEWERIMSRFFADEGISEAELERFEAISQPAYAVLGAPRVGMDAKADDWIAEQMAGRMTREEAITEYHGHYALSLIESDGLPKYSHGGLYEGVDDTSFRGSFFTDCTLVLTQAMIDAAWNHRMPEQAVEYGEALLAAALQASRGNPIGKVKRSFLNRLLGRSTEAISLKDQLDIVETAGRWFVFWGSQGHPIRAYF
jgi:hypothetical protein